MRSRIQKHMANGPEASANRRIPVVEEVLQVGKRVTDTGRGVRLNKTVSEETWRIDETLLQYVVDMTHVPVNVWVAEGELPVQRQEGDTLIVPVLEEVLVVEKRVRLKEEIRITLKAQSHHASERVVLRKERVHAERFDEHAPNHESSLKGDRND